MCCPQTKLNVTSKVKGFENITYKTVSVIRIPELLTNIISCHGFVNNTELSVILSCRIRLVDYYFQKCFVLHEKNLNVFKNVHLLVKQIINTEHSYKHDF